MSGDEGQLLRRLRQAYLVEGAERLAELRADLAALRAGTPGAAASLKARFHRLAGSGGSYGFPGISAIAREAELWLATEPPADAPAAARVGDALARLEAEFGQARREFGE